MKCKKCGTELLDGQKFCSKCGTPIEKNLTTKGKDPSQNSSVNKGKNNKKKLILLISVPILIVLLTIICFVLFRQPTFEGKYIIVSQIDETQTYTFEKDKYVYKSAYDFNEGTYKLDNNSLIITDSDGVEKEWFRQKNYIAMTSSHFDEKIDPSSNLTQSFNYSAQTHEKGYNWTLTEVLVLDSAGNYSWNYRGEEPILGSFVQDETGTYEISGNKLLLKEDGSDSEKTWLIIDNTIYSYVFKKTK